MTIDPIGATGAATPAPAVDPEAREAAEQFERLLVGQLTKGMLDGVGAEGPYSSLLPDALADGIAEGGGLGLADALARSFMEADR